METTAVAGHDISGHDTGQVAEHLDRLLKSDLLRRSASLCHLLQYLVEKAQQADGEHIKESVIAIDVFHRSGEFDSRIDNIVRVHAHRLRKILDTWYAGEGAGDKIRFVMPKGNYMLRIEPNEPRADVEAAEESPVPDLVVVAAAATAVMPTPQRPEAKAPPAVVPQPKPAARPALIWAALFAGIAIGSAVTFLSLRRLQPPANDILMRPPLSALWKSVFRRGTDTVVSFTNPTFLRTSGSPRIYVTYNGPLNAANGAEVNVAPAPPLDKRLAPLGPFFFSDSWTGTGEIIAMHKLTELAADSGYHVKPVRSRALTYADIRNANVIFIGSSWANDMQTKFNLGQMPFQCFGTDKIANKRPEPGEPPAWYAELNPATNELAASYALFSVLPGAGPGTRMVSSSGIDTYSTMAALDLMTTPNGILDLMRHFGTAERETLPDYFQAVIRTEVIRGEPARSSVVAVRAVAGK